MSPHGQIPIMLSTAQSSSSARSNGWSSRSIPEVIDNKVIHLREWELTRAVGVMGTSIPFGAPP